MADYPDYSASDLADFSGRPVSSYPTKYTMTAIKQAVLLFKIGTCLAAFPDGEVEADLAEMGILAMADMIVLSQEFQKVKASPFSSESIGSYSYSKAAAAVSKGEETGVMWFDLAINRLSVCNISDDIPMSGGIEVFEFDRPMTAGKGNNQRLLGPSDLQLSREYGFDPSPIGG